jgi:arabinofuranosyltransferase
MAAARVFSADVYLNVIAVSLLLNMLMLYFLWRSTKDIYRWFFIGLLLLVSSKSFVDYTTSGLENPLTYFLCALFFGTYLDAANAEGAPEENLPRLKKIFVFAGLILANRLDLITLILPPLAAALWKNRSYGFARLAKLALLCAAPVIAWEVVSIVYFGFPWPNTAYAKLSPFMPAMFFINHGIEYVKNSLIYDPIVLIIIAAAIVAALAQGDMLLLALGAGLALNILYVIRIGGDFMAGRMFTPAYLAAVIFFMKAVRFPKLFLKTSVLVLFYLLLLPLSPAKTEKTYGRAFFDSGIMDEKGEYFQFTSLWKYVEYRRAGSPYNIFPAHNWSFLGKRLSVFGPPVQVERCVGLIGYNSGLKEIIIDNVGLGDPFLARLAPINNKSSIGHFERGIPEGYLRSVASGENVIVDPLLKQYYDKIKIITQGRVFSRERFIAVLKMNTGGYDNLLANYNKTMGNSPQ